MVYFDSFLFVVIASVLRYGIANTEMTAARCKTTDILCLTIYLSTKVIYLFLIEKACTVNGRSKPRLDSKLWLLNMMGMLVFYILILIFEFLHRFTTVESGVCIMNGKIEALIGLILWDIGAKVYLSSLFFIPIWILFASAVIHWMTSYDSTCVIPPPLVISNIEYAVDNSHPSARSRRNTIGAQSPPEWLRAGHLQPLASGQSLIGMLSDDDDKELRFAHHRNLLEIERRSSKGGPSGVGRAMGPSSKSAAEDALDSEKAEMMVVAWNAMSDSSSPSLKPVEHGAKGDRDRDRDRDRDTGKRMAAAVDGLGDADRSGASDTSSLSRPTRDYTSKSWGKRVETHGSVRRALQHVKDGVRSRNESAEKQPPSL
ncbi:hypothetical protein Daus18300_003716 [Diaporthe australafricana]|uniref:Integral membrane protein n=1 Tax=Diaporthe australafricana TaxID=127596 RepID=A0ABR3XDY6_9PEZI